MIKGVTLVSAAGSAEEFERITSFLGELGFEPGKGWDDGEGRGAAFLAPVGNLELVTGRPPAVPPLLIETTQLDHLHAAIHQWMLATYPTDAEAIATLLSPPVETHWNSRLFTVKFDESLTVGFW